MKAIVISILLFLTIYLPDGKLSAQTIWYVNRDATGSNNGTSWANAWKSPSNINWNNISAGDTIYVSGGSDSTTYIPSTIYGFTLGTTSGPTPNWTFASGNPVVIAPAWHTNHNGDVWFATVDPDHVSILRIGNISNLKITGLNFIDKRASGENGPFIQLGNGDWGDVDSLIYFENCYLQSNGLNGFFYLSSYKVTLSNNYMEQIANSSPNDNDPIGISSGKGSHTIENNTIIMRNDNLVTDAHRDGIQISNFGETSEDVATMIIRNNLILHTTSGASWTCMIYSSNPRTDVEWYLYNNIIASNNTASSVGGANFGNTESVGQKVFCFNNTFIMRDMGDGLSTALIVSGGADSTFIRNNLFVNLETVDKIYSLQRYSGGGPLYYINSNYNGFFAANAVTTMYWPDTGFGIYEWDDWTGDGFDLNSIIGVSDTVSFVDAFSEDITDYYTETGRGLGSNLSTDFAYILARFPDLANDILGNPRGETWDIGALQYGGVPPNGINVKGKVFLQGPFSNNSMATNLNQASLIPGSQPYNQPPWNYNGNESFNPSSNSTVVDWVLVELRSASNPAQVVARRAAVLKNNGLLIRTNGIEGVHFNNVDPGSYYIAVYHRNHLAIMSAAPVQLSSSSTVYDFTTAMNKAYGQNPMVELGAGKYGMYATDGNADGIVNSADRDDVWLIQNGNMGYLEGDFNMNSGVTVHDVNQLWNLNNGAETQVP